MSKPENSFIAGVHKYLDESCYAEKMANPYRGGTPDVWYSGPERDLWVEYKFIALPKQPGTLIVPDLSPLQIKWLNARYDQGRSVRVVVGCREGAFIFNAPHQWVHGVVKAVFLDKILTRRDLAKSIVRYCTNPIIPEVFTAHQPDQPQPSSKASSCEPTKTGSSRPSKLLSKHQKNPSTAIPCSTDLRSVSTRRRRIVSPTT